jgi:hypothetical protein
MTGGLFMFQGGAKAVWCGRASYPFGAAEKLAFVRRIGPAGHQVFSRPNGEFSSLAARSARGWQPDPTC